jgi:hypothetical protein
LTNINFNSVLNILKHDLIYVDVFESQEQFSGLFREDLVKQFIDQRDPWKANYFKRAIDAPHLIFSAPYILGKLYIDAPHLIFSAPYILGKLDIDAPHLGGAVYILGM